MKKIYFSLSTITILSILSFSSAAEDLLTVYKTAIENDSQFRASQAEYRALLETKNQSIALLLPTLSASAHYTDNENETIAATTTRDDFSNKGYSLTLTQPIYRHENFV